LHFNRIITSACAKFHSGENKKYTFSQNIFRSSTVSLWCASFSVHPLGTLMNTGFPAHAPIVVFHMRDGLPQNVVPPRPNELLTHLAVVATNKTVEPDDFQHLPSFSLQFFKFRLCGQKGGVPLMATKKAPAKKAAPAKAAPAKKAAPKKKAAAAKAPAKKAAPKKK
jgi:hypothetical protein